MPRPVFVVILLLVVAACTGSPAMSPAPPTASPAPSSTPGADSPTAPPTPTALPTESPISHGPAGLVADLRALGIEAEEKSQFSAEPLSTLGVQLCVAGEPVQVYVYGTPQEAAAVAAQIDPEDPSHLGRGAIIDWAGDPKFWLRDRILVLYLGTDEDVQAALVSLMGEPFAKGQGRPPLLGGDDC